MVQRHQAPLQFDEATVVVHQSPPKKMQRRGKRRMELVVNMPRRWLAATDFIWQDAHPVALGCNSRIIDSFCNGTSQAKTNTGK
jgi:hypothetical protein